MSAEEVELRPLPIIKTAVSSSDTFDVTDAADFNLECRTPKSPRHMIPPAVSCPPAPRKLSRRRPPPPCKRRLRRIALIEIFAREEEIECFFRVSEETPIIAKRRCM